VKDPTATSRGTLGAIPWITPGVLMAIDYVVSATFLCITVIGIPFGLQSIKMAGLALQPFGKKIVRTNDAANFYAGTAEAAPAV